MSQTIATEWMTRYKNIPFSYKPALIASFISVIVRENIEYINPEAIGTLLSLTELIMEDYANPDKVLVVPSSVKEIEEIEEIGE
jgi:hypothetical protein